MFFFSCIKSTKKKTNPNSVDIRDRDFKAAKRWSDETVFANRAYFLFEKQPGELAVQNAKDSDSGVYRCRVDFKVAQTRNSKVNLTIIRKYSSMQSNQSITFRSRMKRRRRYFVNYGIWRDCLSVSRATT